MKISYTIAGSKSPPPQDGKIYVFTTGPHATYPFVVQDDELFIFRGGSIHRHHWCDDGVENHFFDLFDNKIILENS